MNSDSKLPASSNRHHRRTFIGSTVLRGGMLVSGVAFGAGVIETSSASAATLIPAQSDLFRVRIEMDIEGNVNLPKDPLVPDSEKQLFPVTAKTTLDYEERYLRPRGASRDQPVLAVERHYHEAKVDSKLHRTVQSLALRDDVKRIVARREELPETVYSTDDYLTHDEVDLLRTPISSVDIDRLIPEALARGERGIRNGAKFPVESDQIATALNLTAVADSKVEMEVVELGTSDAKLQLRGELDGSVSGVPTKLRLVGKLTYDRRGRTTSWAAVAIHETREIGKAEPGFDITATIRMVRKPLPRPQSLSTRVIAVDFDNPPPQERLLMAVASQRVGASALLDRRWRVMQDNVGQAILRMIDNERTIAQCNLRPLPRLGEGEQWTLEAFERDVKRSIGGSFSELLQSGQEVTDAGLRMLRVVAAGQVEGVPIQWIVMHFSDDDGHRVQATLMMDGESVPLLDGSDVQLAASLKLLDQQLGLASKSESEASKPSAADSAAKRREDDESSASDLVKTGKKPVSGEDSGLKSRAVSESSVAELPTPTIRR